MNKFGLVGKNISYSFSREYFTRKFRAEDIDAVYVNFDLTDISEIERVLGENTNLTGFNVTIPYKEAIINYLDSVDPVASRIGAVNTVKIGPSGSLTGFNTDYIGFTQAILPYLKQHHKNALILGTGGASKAVKYALDALNIHSTFVSRNPTPGQLSYTELSPGVLKENTVIVNSTPLGTFPETSKLPEVPLDHITSQHLIFDLIYNPAKTTFMNLSQARGATVLNGQRMLELQAEKAWEIWNENQAY